MLKRLAIESGIATVVVFLAMWLISLIPVNLSALQPLEQAINAIDIMDIYYAQVNTDRTEISQDVVLVNIGNADRYQIARLIEAIGKGQPAAIGVDVFFAQPRDAFPDSCLAHAVNHHPVVLGAAYQTEQKTLRTSFDALVPKAVGYTNFIGKDRQTETIRSFKPMVNTPHGTYASFAWQLARMARPKGMASAKVNPVQDIRYIGDYLCFRHYETADVLGGQVDPSTFAGKVVIVGYAGRQFGDPNTVEDRFFTPKNPQISGRSFPDMDGMVIHANAVEMLLSGKTITRTGVWFKWLFAIVVTYLHVMFYMYLMVKIDYYFDPLALLLQIASSLLIVFILFYVYHHFQLRIQVLGGLVGIAFAVEILFVYEALAHTIFKKFDIKSIVIDA